MAAAQSHLPAGNGETFVGMQPKVSFRLSYDLAELIRTFLYGCLSDMGYGTSWSEGVNVSCGITDTTSERIHMLDAEAWCDKKKVWVANGKSAKLKKCREAFLILAEAGEYNTIQVLKKMYGEPTAFDRFNSSLLGELAPLAELTDEVIAEAEKIEARRQRDALAKFNKFWANSDEGPEAEKARRIHLNRILAPVPLDTARVIREGLDTFVPFRENESKAEHAERQMTRRSARVEFISAVNAQSDTLLANASLAYKDVWMQLRNA